jgi:hypothetical protein
VEPAGLEPATSCLQSRRSPAVIARDYWPIERSRGPLCPKCVHPQALTQPIRAGDIKTGTLRVPGPERLFPRQRTLIQVEIARVTKDFRWDPGYGADRDRSGVVGIGKTLAANLTLGSELEINLRDGIYQIG